MTNGLKLKAGFALLAVSAAVTLSACSKDDPANLIQSAREYQSKGDHQAAIIQFKNVLQAQPENGEARLELGRSALITGDPVTAESEFRKALASGQSAATVVPLIAAAMLEGGEAEKVITEFGGKKLDDPQADAELRARVGEAQLRTGRPREAANSFAAALGTDPSNVRAKLGQARLAASDEKLDEALETVEQVVAANPQSVDALVVLAELKVARGDRAGAGAVLERAVAASPATPLLRFQLISTLIDDGQFDAAAEQVTAARAIRASAVQLQYFEAHIAFGKKDLPKAREAAEQVLKRAPGHVPSMVLLGSIDLQEKQFAKAESQFQSAVSLAPGNTFARRLLAQSYLASGQPARALETLRPMIVSKTPMDTATSMLLGEAYLANGNLEQAASSFEAASRSAAPSAPQAAMARIRLSQIAMVSGDPKGGAEELESISAGEGAPIQAELALISGHLRQGETGKAKEVAQRLVKKRPDDPVAQNILGAVLAIRNEGAAARAAFNKALELNPGFTPAVISLARLDLRENKPADARARFESLLAKDPKNEVAMLGLAEALARSGAPSAEIAAVLQRAVSAQPQSVPARVALIHVYLRSRDTRAALTAAQEAAASLGQDPRILDALGLAQLAVGDVNQAIDTFNRMASADPQSPTAHLRLAAVYASRKEHEKSAEALLRAQKIAPGNTEIGRELVVTYQRMGKNDEALKQARALQVSAPKSPVGFVLEGNVHAVSKQWAAAEKAYREGLKAHPASAALAMPLHSVLVVSKKAEADGFARKWTADHPKDMAFRGYLGERAVRARDWKGAVAQYEIVVAQQPDNFGALNNLAWSLLQLEDPRALGYAERALKLAPENPRVLDTMGVLMTSKGDAAKGSEYLARAVALAPDEPQIRLHYAKALLKAGRGDEARKELTQLQSVSQDFPGKSEIPGLLKQ